MSTPDRIPTEHEEQRELVRWFRQTWPGVLIHAIPNGGARSKATAGRLKAEGVVSGVPDLFVPAWRLWIEMKRVKGGSISPEQRSIIKQLETVGYCVIVGKGAEDAKRQISAFFDKLVESPPRWACGAALLANTLNSNSSNERAGDVPGCGAGRGRDPAVVRGFEDAARALGEATERAHENLD